MVGIEGCKKTKQPERKTEGCKGRKEGCQAKKKKKEKEIDEQKKKNHEKTSNRKGANAKIPEKKKEKKKKRGMASKFLRHTVFVWLKEDVSKSQVETLTSKFMALKREPGLDFLRYHAGPDLKLKPDQPDYVISGDFGSLEAYQTYATHPAHQAVVEFLKPLTTRPSVRAQIWIED